MFPWQYSNNRGTVCVPQDESERRQRGETVRGKERECEVVIYRHFESGYNIVLNLLLRTEPEPSLNYTNDYRFRDARKNEALMRCHQIHSAIHTETHSLFCKVKAVLLLFTFHRDHRLNSRRSINLLRAWCGVCYLSLRLNFNISVAVSRAREQMQEPFQGLWGSHVNSTALLAAYVDWCLPTAFFSVLL